MNAETGLVHFDAACQAIAMAHSIDEVKAIRDKAEALRQYARQQRFSLKGQNQFAEIKLRAERRAGEMLAAPDGLRGKGQRDQIFHDEGFAPPKLSDLGISESQSHRWQWIAKVPEQRFEQFVAEVNEANDELTSRAMYHLARELERLESQQFGTPAMPEGKYQVLYADPPWQYADILPEGYGAATHHYRTMSIEELCALPVPNLSADNAVLFMWATSPLLEQTFQVVNAWGFTYKASFIWDKVRHNYGHYNSVRHELLLVATRGSFLPQTKTLHDSVIQIERTEHSEKPEYFRHLAEDMYPDAKKIELFARTTAPGWDSWGNEVD